MKRLVLAICSLATIVAPFVCHAQTKSTLEKLQNDWSLQFPCKKSMDVTVRFSDKVYTSITSVEGHTFEKNYPFYLSNEIEEKFDSTKVGKITEGKYIVWLFKNPQKDSREWLRHFEIQELSDTSLVYKHLYNNSIFPFKRE